MNDLRHTLSAARMHAEAVIAYNDPVGAEYADGTITITDYAQLIAAAAAGSITYGAPENGDTIVVNGTTLTKAAVGGAAEFSTIGELEALIEAITGINSSENGTVITVTAASAGEAGNAITLALGVGNTGTMAISGATLTGGRDHASFTLDDVTVVQGTGFTAETSNDVTATNLATALDAAAAAGAAAVGAVVTCTATARGVAGNALVLTQDVTGGSTVSGSGTLAGGVDGDTITVDGNEYTCVVGTSGSDEFNSAAELAALIHAESGLTAANASGVITVKVDAVGTAGNAKEITLGEDNAGDMEVTQEFEGGAAELYTDVFTMDEGLDEVEIFLNITAITAASTVDVTPQVSTDGGTTWFDAEVEAGTALAFPQKSAIGKDQLYMKRAAKKVRCKIVLGGTSPSVTGDIYMNGRQD